ncbi:MAG: hypothetical protein HOP23_01345 [Methylococcaceae bacterium]|nr:hypothetical protein [Methylococcaceae bacterium]
MNTSKRNTPSFKSYNLISYTLTMIGVSLLLCWGIEFLTKEVFRLALI